MPGGKKQLKEQSPQKDESQEDDIQEIPTIFKGKMKMA